MFLSNHVLVRHGMELTRRRRSRFLRAFVIVLLAEIDCAGMAHFVSKTYVRRSCRAALLSVRHEGLLMVEFGWQ